MEIYMVFPYLEHDLRGLLDAPGVILSMGQMKTYVQQLFQGLDYLHGNHILHRDLKCANLLINNEGILKIGDFGLARPYEPEGHGTLTNMVVTRWYRPPELLLGSTKYT
ncbi:Cyclin-dependent kinase 12, partial [Coelomomyces lativittatus]